MVGAALAYGLGAMYIRLKFRGVPPLVVSFGACAVAALLTLPPALATVGGNSPDLGEIAAVVSLGVVGTAVAFVLYFVADRRGRRRQGGAGRIPDPADRARLRRDPARRGDHRRGDRRAGADPDRRRARERRARRVSERPASRPSKCRGAARLDFARDGRHPLPPRPHRRARPAHVVSRARKAGVDRMLAIGMTGDSCRHALAAADEHEEVYVSVGRHPHESEGFDDAGLDGAARAVRAPEGARDRRGGPRLQARLRAARRPAALVRRADRAGEVARPAARGPHARGGRRHDRRCSTSTARAST